ncbi:LysR family transcriptional regulator [Streptomyces sp. LNU-CPARS28]|uniref:LysR family transcriptional regulator n=1 Tax=Streptomyces sp. LNU-CPARS28 TaxID=3137371 RepID=UPI0031374A32
MMERAETEIFLTLAEELHFARTAARLHVSPALVTQTVKKTERRLGVALFARSSQSGRWVGAAREVFELRNPECGVRVVETQLHHHVAQLRDGTADLLLITLPVDEPDLTVGAVVTRGVRYLAVAANHRLAEREAVSFEDLAGETFISVEGTVPAEWIDFHMPRLTPGGQPIGRHSEPCATYAEALALVATGRAVVPGDAQLPLLYPAAGPPLRSGPRHAAGRAGPGVADPRRRRQARAGLRRRRP